MHVSSRPAGLVALGIACAFVSASFNAEATCLASGMQVQILGSGGPNHSGGRASAGYIVWVDGVGRIMVDAGSGTKDQFHRAGASLTDIELFAISHFHPDHSSEFPAILWPSGSRGLLVGPAAGAGFPSVTEFSERMWGENGVYPVLGERLENLSLQTVDTASGEIHEVWGEDGIRVRGIGVPHANVPTIGFRVDYGDASIVFSSDQNGSNPAFIDFIDGVDVLVIHMTVGENATGFGAQLHAKPSVWGQLASDGSVGEVLVSHIGTQNAVDLQPRLDVLRNNYDGPITVGEDLMCVNVG